MGEQEYDNVTKPSRVAVARRVPASSNSAGKTPSAVHDDPYEFEYDDKQVKYVTEDDLDENDFVDDSNRNQPRCLCCGIRAGMFVNAFFMLLMTLSSYFFISFLLSSNRTVVSFIAASNMKISSAYVMWASGLLGSLVGVVTPLVRHPYSRKQFAYLNLLTTVLFLVTLFHHGLKAANSVAVDLPEVINRHLDKTARGSSARLYSEKVTKLGFQVAVAMAFNALFNSGGGLEFKDCLCVALMVSKIFGLMVLCVFPSIFVCFMTSFAAAFASDAKTQAHEFRITKRGDRLLPGAEAHIMP